MKKIIIFLAYIALVVLTANPSYADIKSEEKVDLIVKSFLSIERSSKKIEIIHGESEFNKRERIKQEAQIMEVKNRQLITREYTRSYVKQDNYDLDSLRLLYKEAGSKFSVDWRLIEAVHQVETGKSTDTCKSSYAGAVGPMQFLPSTFRAYQNEGGNICGLRDSVFAAAKLLASGGASNGDIDSALFNYNHSWSYVQKVKSVMYSI